MTYRDDHPGACCDSCLDDKDAGYNDLDEVCCCEQLYAEDKESSTVTISERRTE